MLSGWRNREGGALERALLAVATVLIVNTAMLLVAAGVLTLPLGLAAGSETLYRWRHHHEEYLVATFAQSLRRHVGRRLAIGWSALGACVWGVAVVLEGTTLVRPWRLVVPALGVAELVVAVPVAWVALALAWASDAPTGPILRTALLLTAQMPLAALGLSLVTLVGAVVVLADPLLVVVGLVALVGLAGQWLTDWGLARRGVVLWRPSSDDDTSPHPGPLDKGPEPSRPGAAREASRATGPTAPTRTRNPDGEGQPPASRPGE